MPRYDNRPRTTERPNAYVERRLTRCDGRKPTTDGPYREGYTRIAQSGPLTLEEHFTLWEPARVMAFYVHRTNHPFMTAYAVADTAMGCDLCWRIGMLFRGFDLLSGPLITRILQRQATNGFPKLETLART